ncbi:putative lipid II flippase FtsW [Immundisolibacter sp.]|uniref:putative lipid II flippase FtsW n=1 Tax=Immundisolibacter sp. TaxID=1934948 RepID=UPI00261FEA19|nr:putative lipid II flippase FtsW [Immundisolibacter sp.]MDD3650384.1 putative lipid II flippase FtsW [Immundisolibacter sp.]
MTSPGVRAPAAAGLRGPAEWDYALLGVAALLAAIGLIGVYSASITVAARTLGNGEYYLQRQAMYLALGVAGGYFVLHTRLELWHRIAGFAVLGATALLALVLLPGIGIEVNGASRWLGAGGLRVQPSELAKLAFLMFAAARLSEADSPELLRERMLVILVSLGITGALLLAEPDFGSFVVLAAATAGLLFLYGVRWLYFIALGGTGLAALAALAVASPYRMARLTSFLRPFDDPFGAGFQLSQSLIAFGRGSWFGVGLGNSVQKLFYLPEAHTDFLLAVLAEELGLFAVLAVIGLFGFVVVRAFAIARRAALNGDGFAALLAYGLGLTIGFQAFVNLGVNMGVLPTKGLTLPLMSYGGTSLIVSCLQIALLARVDHEQRMRRGAAPLGAPAMTAAMRGRA